MMNKLVWIIAILILAVLKIAGDRYEATETETRSGAGASRPTAGNPDVVASDSGD